MSTLVFIIVAIIACISEDADRKRGTSTNRTAQHLKDLYR